MSTQGPLSPATIITDDSNGGDINWTNPGNAVSSNNSYALVTMTFTHFSYWLVVKNFGFSIPSGATINGVVVEVECNANADNLVEGYLVKNGTIQSQGTNEMSNMPSHITSSDAYVSAPDEGLPPTLWGIALTSSDVNNSGFGVAFFIQGGISQLTFNVDHVRMTVDYTASSILSSQRVLKQINRRRNWYKNFSS